MIELALIIGAALALLLSGFYSGAETGVYSLNRVRLRVRAERQEPTARRLAALMAHPQDLVITALLGTNVFDYLMTAFVTALLLRLALSAGKAELYATLLCTPLILILGAIVPKDWFRRESDRLMYQMPLPLLASVRLARATGLVWLLRRLTRMLIRAVDPARAAAGEEALPRARMLSLLREGAARGGLTTFQRDVIERVMNISDVRVGRVMIPRHRTAAVPENVTREDFLRAARMAHFSRLPVWRDQPRKVIGIINVYNVLTDEAARPIREHVQNALVLLPQETVPGALVKLQQARQAMAIVNDRYGNCIGILTVKDLVEEIVGDLEAW